MGQGLRSSQLMVVQETEACAAQITRHAINPLVADGWVGQACSCCCMALVHAHALAASLKLVLAPRLQARLFKTLEQVRGPAQAMLVSVRGNQVDHMLGV